MSFVLRKLNQVQQASSQIFGRIQKQTDQGIKDLSEGTRSQSRRDTEHSMGLAFGFGFFLETDWTWQNPRVNDNSRKMLLKGGRGTVEAREKEESALYNVR